MVRMPWCQTIGDTSPDTGFLAFLDDITNLRDPELFQYLIQAELNARTQRDPKKSASDPFRNPSYVASTIANKYVLSLLGSC
jgi:hypothetical protein